MKTKKLRQKYKSSKRQNTSGMKNIKGGLLTTNPDADLINTHICNVKEGKKKETPGFELLCSISKSFQLNSSTLGYFMEMYKSTNNKWFKFVCIKYDEEEYVYIIDGARINKHSVCMLEGVLHLSKEKNEYEELNDAYRNLLFFKENYGSNMMSMTDIKLEECRNLIKNVDNIIQRDIKCMPVICAGSGSINDDGTICINDKSGHYKPTEYSMMRAKEIFEKITQLTIEIKKKPDKELLLAKYGEHAENYSGICL